MFKKDTIYQDAVEVTDFTFNSKVALVFPDMMQRSIPGYASLITTMQAVFCSIFANNKEKLIYDLGCSVGSVTLALAKALPVNTNFIGVDISAEMLAQYQKSMQLANLTERVKIMQQNIVDVSLVPCDAISINFTLQFLQPNKRQSVLNKCYKAMHDDGLLFIAEKTIVNDDIIAWHEQFKRNNDYSELEISQKRLAIEKVMKIDKESTIIKRCRKAGFSNIAQVFHSLGFKAWVIRK